MSGTQIGGIKASKTMKAKYGDTWYAEIGAIGGKTPTDKLKGFACNKDRAREAGRIGGLKSRKGAKHAMSYEVEHHQDSSRNFLDKLLGRQA
jgi:general stress protein YciG